MTSPSWAESSGVRDIMDERDPYCSNGFGYPLHETSQTPPPMSWGYSSHVDRDNDRRLPMVALFDNAQPQSPPLPVMEHVMSSASSQQPTPTCQASVSSSKKVSRASFQSAVLILVLLIFIAMVLAVSSVAITFARENAHEPYTVVYGIDVKLDGKVFGSSLHDLSSDDFTSLENDYCLEIEIMFPEMILSCEVDYFANVTGSVIVHSTVTFDLVQLEDVLKRQGKIPGNDVILIYIRDVIEEHRDSDGPLGSYDTSVVQITQKDLTEEVHYELTVTLDMEYSSSLSNLSSYESKRLTKKYCSCILGVASFVIDCEVTNLSLGSVVVLSRTTAMKVELMKASRELGIIPDAAGLMQTFMKTIQDSDASFFRGANLTAKEISEWNDGPLATALPEPTPYAEPMSPSAEPMSPSAEPMSPSAEPVSPSAEPMSPTAEPMSPSAEPMSPSAEPMTSSAEPMSSSEPMTSTPLVTASSQPGTISTQPVTSENKPVTSTQPVESPREPTTASSRQPVTSPTFLQPPATSATFAQPVTITEDTGNSSTSDQT